MLKYKLKIFFLFLSTLFFNMYMYAQQNNKIDLSKALKVGDTFTAPASIMLMRGKEKEIDWKALEDKVVLLDFFDTFCGTCIEIMPKLQKLEEKYPDKFKVITVTWQDRATMDKLFKNNAFLKENKVNLPVIYVDNYLKSLFPHVGVPHEVLLYKGKVQVITSQSLVTEENILKLYSEKSIDLPLKDDFGKGNLLGKVNGEVGAFKAGTIFSGYQNGVPTEGWTFETDSLTGLYRSTYYNYSMYGALMGLTSQAKIKSINYMPRMDRVVWKVKDSTKYYDFEDIGEEWLLKNAISYERYDFQARPDSIQAHLILADFLSFYSLKIYEEKRKMTCLVLSPCPVVPYDANEKANRMKYTNSLVFSIFLDFSGKYPPTVDHVGYNDELLIGNFGSLEDLNTQLAAYGIKAGLAEEEIAMLVIEEVN